MIDTPGLIRNGPASEAGPPGVAVRERNVLRVLAGGFVLMIALLGTDGFVGVRSLLSIRTKVSSLTEHQFRNVVLIDEVQRAQSAIGSVVYQLSLGAAPDPAKLDAGIADVEHTLANLFAQVPPGDPDLPYWREVERASGEVTAEAHRLLAAGAGGNRDVSRMLADREHLLLATANLIRANHGEAEAIRDQIERTTSNQLWEDGVLLSGCLLIAAACGWLVLLTARRLYHQITEQAAELTNVSWQLLEKQESLARRLSHELHDELGQSLTALKTNFSRHAAAPCVDPAWMQDCNELLRDSIRSAHEISQLLRPTILDDFGLDSALAWLCDRFEERNEIEVDYQSDFRGRLDAHTETHLFRIAQEALTNVARHSGAKSVKVHLSQNRGFVRLAIADDGTGLPERGDYARSRFGLTGMKARARSLQGDLEIRSRPGQGLEIDVVFPRREVVREEADTHLVG